ncbi:MAG: SDR family oxidoreductase [Sphingobacteriia bacterium]|nr:MAG: SDR family oxidoreductase [Sphingobacteriia bacterium]
MFSLKNKTAIVTGGGSGIGKSIAIIFARQGAHICILDMDSTGSDHVANQITENGGTASVHICNIADQETVKTVVAEILTANGKIDILINNAGVAHIGNIENTDTTDMDRLFSINVKGAYNCMQTVIPTMKQGGGVIINLASVAATLGISDRFAYSMTKGAVLSMTMSVAKDYIGYGIRCNSISPGRVHTPFVDGFIAKNYPGKEAEMFDKLSKTQPIGRMGQPDEIAYLALYLCSEEAAFITGCDYPIDGGFTKLNS